MEIDLDLELEFRRIRDLFNKYRHLRQIIADFEALMPKMTKDEKEKLCQLLKSEAITSLIVVKTSVMSAIIKRTQEAQAKELKKQARALKKKDKGVS